jgi:hypothetical protein
MPQFSAHWEANEQLDLVGLSAIFEHGFSAGVGLNSCKQS